MGYANTEVGRRIPAADGTFKVVDAVVRGTTFYAYNNDTVDIVPGTPVAAYGFTGQNSTNMASMPVWNVTNNSTPLAKFIIAVVRFGGTVTKAPIGVALDTIKPGEYGEIAGAGSFLCCYADGTLTSGAGDVVVAGSDPGTVAPIAAATNPSAGEVLGIVVVKNYPTSGVGTASTGSPSMIGILVNPC